MYILNPLYTLCASYTDARYVSDSSHVQLQRQHSYIRSSCNIIVIHLCSRKWNTHRNNGKVIHSPVHIYMTPSE